MRIALNVVGALCLLLGGVWLLQGMNVIPGSFMTGSREWAINGAAVMVLGGVVLMFANRRRV